MSKELVKKHSESIAHDTAGSLIADQLIRGMPTMLSWIAALFAYLGGQPIWQIILIGSIVFLTLTLAWVLISVRFRESKTEKRSELQGDSLSLRLSNAATQNECPDKWLHEIVEEELELFSSRVKILRGWISHIDTSSASPYVEFSFSVFNGSVLTVTIDDKTAGYIGFARQRLKRHALEMTQNTVIELKHGHEGQFTIEQKLDESEVHLITKTDVTVYSPYFDIEHLTVMVKGGKYFSQARPQRLTLPSPLKIP